MECERVYSNRYRGSRLDDPAAKGARPASPGACQTGPAARTLSDCVGRQIIKKQLQDGVDIRRIGLKIPKGAPARQHAKIETMDGEEVGQASALQQLAPDLEASMF